MMPRALPYSTGRQRAGVAVVNKDGGIGHQIERVQTDLPVDPQVFIRKGRRLVNRQPAQHVHTIRGAFLDTPQDALDGIEQVGGGRAGRP